MRTLFGRSLLVSVLLLSAVSPATAGYCGRHAVLSTTLDDGTEIGVFLPEEQMTRAPRWTPGQGGPPLGIAELVDVATAWALHTYTRYDDVRISSIGLNSRSCGALRESWYYVVHFTPIIDGNRLFGGGNFAAVLMDGTVVAPRKK